MKDKDPPELPEDLYALHDLVRMLWAETLGTETAMVENTLDAIMPEGQNGVNGTLCGSWKGRAAPLTCPAMARELPHAMAVMAR